MRTAAVIGHFAKSKQDLGGQTIKTKTISQELQSRFGQDQVLEVDTYGGLKTLFKAPFQVFYALKNSRNVIIFPANNAVRVYAPLLSLGNGLFNRKRKLHYAVIGGWLPQFLQSKRKLSKCLKRFDGIYVETKTMKTALEAQGFKNVFVMPNCKKLAVLSEEELVYPAGAPYKLCTFSRVSREKGIEDAVNAVAEVNDTLGYQAFSLDVYGQVDADQVDWFDALQKQFPEYVRYGGVVPFDKSVEVLKDYFALLFPTHYKGEGFAGTLVDAYAAGVPVIASDWKYNSELVTEATGYLYPTGEQKVFVDVLKTVAVKPEMILEKKLHCLKETEKYRVDRAVQVLIDRMERN